MMQGDHPEECRLCDEGFDSFLDLYMHVDKSHPDQSDAYWSISERAPPEYEWRTNSVEPELIDIDEVTS